MPANAFLARLRDDAVIRPDSATVHQAARCLLDYLGVTLVGAAEMKTAAHSVCNTLSPQGGPCPVLGFTGLSSDAATAALVMGMASHTVELDDGHRHGMVHPGAPVFSALLPLAALHGLPTDRILVGAIAGYEACIRMARALQPRLRGAGHHATGVCGTIGAAIACSLALGQNEEQLKTTLAAACTSASGILKVIRDASSLKPYNAGQAAVAGLHAAAAGASSLHGPHDVLAKADGFLQIMGTPPENARPALSDPAPPSIHGIYVKPYASCRHCHAPVEAALRLLAEHRIDPAAISRIRVTTHRLALHLHDHTRICGISSAKMSIPYSVAAALSTGDGGLAAFSQENVACPDILNLTQRIEVVASEEMSARVPAIRPAEVAIFTANGVVCTRRVDLPLGEPETPLDDHALTAKFLSLAICAGLSPTNAQTIATNLLGPSPNLNTALLSPVQS